MFARQPMPRAVSAGRFSGSSDVRSLMETPSCRPSTSGRILIDGNARFLPHIWRLHDVVAVVGGRTLGMRRRDSWGERPNCQGLPRTARRLTPADTTCQFLPRQSDREQVGVRHEKTGATKGVPPDLSKGLLVTSRTIATDAVQGRWLGTAIVGKIERDHGRT